MQPPETIAASVVQDVFEDYVRRRIARYRSVKLDSLLVKDVVMFALRGVDSPAKFVVEAFSAWDSSSEETSMGNAWQRVAAELAPSAVEAGDLWANRGSDLWVIEVKSQPNTLNAGGLADAVRKLQARVAERTRAHRVRSQAVKAAIGVIRGVASDELRVYGSPAPEYADINGFEYRYLVGSKFWSWLIGRPSVVSILSDIEIDGSDLAISRIGALARLQQEMEHRLDDSGLHHTIDSVQKLADEVLG